MSDLVFGRLVHAMPPYVSTDEDLAVVPATIVGVVRDQLEETA